MAHWRFWLCPSPQLFFCLFVFFFIVVLAYSLVMWWSESVINK